MTYEFRNLNQNIKSNENNENDKIEKMNNVGENKNEKTSFSIYLDVHCPPTLYRPFIISGIKKELKIFAKKLQILIEKNFHEKNNFIGNENFVNGNGEIEILKFIEKDFTKYQIKKIDKNIIENLSDYNNENYMSNNQFKNYIEKYENVENNIQKTNDEEDYEIFRRVSNNEFEQNTNFMSYSDKYQYGPISRDFSVNFPNDEISAKFLRLRDHW